MAIKVYKVADIVENQIALSGGGRFRLNDIRALITCFEEVADPAPESAWVLAFSVGEGPAARVVKLDVPRVLSKSDSTESPKFLIRNETTGIFYFRDRLFMPERLPMSVSEMEEIFLRIKKATFDEEADLSNLRAAVANLEAAIEFQKSGPKRDPIPEDVKLVVWARDGGSCVRCGSKQELHFDHVIPVVKGGGNSVENIQILCQVCNLKKSDKIAIT